MGYIWRFGYSEIFRYILGAVVVGDLVIAAASGLVLCVVKLADRLYNMRTLEYVWVILEYSYTYIVDVY